MEHSQKIPGYKGLDIQYDFCNEKILHVSGNVGKEDRLDFVNYCWQTNMETETNYEVVNYNKKQIYNIMLRKINGCVIAESDIGSKSLTNDMLEEIIDHPDVANSLENY